MKEELIRVENGRFRRDEGEYRFEISISRGECIGIYVDDHFTSGTAYLDVFKGVSRMEGGRAFALGRGWARRNWSGGSPTAPGSWIATGSIPGS